MHPPVHAARGLYEAMNAADSENRFIILFNNFSGVDESGREYRCLPLKQHTFLRTAEGGILQCKEEAAYWGARYRYQVAVKQIC